MERSMSLVDLPSAWLLLLSTKLTAETAARARCTCKLMQKMIDETWEPEEVPIPPHRRSVPLTVEQLQAQLPPQKPWPKNHWRYMQAGAGKATTGSSNSSSEDGDDDQTSSEDDDEDGYYSDDEFGRQNGLLSAFGPALTRLTANQVINKLQGKPMLCWLHAYHQSPSKHDTVQERMSLVQEVTFSNIPHKWPPVDRDILDQDCWLSKGPDSSCEGFCFFGSCLTPLPVQELNSQEVEYSWGVYRPYAKEPHPIFTYRLEELDSRLGGLLVTTEASFQPANESQYWRFLDGDAASDAECFDWLLAFGRETARFYVFLDPTRLHFTGRLRSTTAS